MAHACLRHHGQIHFVAQAGLKACSPKSDSSDGAGLACSPKSYSSDGAGLACSSKGYSSDGVGLALLLSGPLSQFSGLLQVGKGVGEGGRGRHVYLAIYKKKAHWLK